MFRNIKLKKAFLDRFDLMWGLANFIKVKLMNHLTEGWFLFGGLNLNKVANSLRALDSKQNKNKNLC